MEKSVLLVKAQSEDEAALKFVVFLEDVTRNFMVNYTIGKVYSLIQWSSTAKFNSKIVNYKEKYKYIKTQLKEAVIRDNDDEIICFGRQLDDIVNMEYTPAISFFEISTNTFSMPEEHDNWWVCEVYYTKRNY